jgi:CRP-like cAMP-binding protein
MPRRSPYEIKLTEIERDELRHRASSFTLPHWVVMRAKMILLAAEGHTNDCIAEKLGTHREVVSRWRKRFHLSGLAGLEGSPGKGVRKVRSDFEQGRSESHTGR